MTAAWRSWSTSPPTRTGTWTSIPTNPPPHTYTQHVGQFTNWHVMACDVIRDWLTSWHHNQSHFWLCSSHVIFLWRREFLLRLQLQLLSYMLWAAPLNMVVATSPQLMNSPGILILFLWQQPLLPSVSQCPKHPLSLMYTSTHVDKDLCYITTNTAAVADMAHRRAWWSGVRGRAVAYYMHSIQTEIEDTHY